jgi:hypothetical protein
MTHYSVFGVEITNDDLFTLTVEYGHENLITPEWVPQKCHHWDKKMDFKEEMIERYPSIVKYMWHMTTKKQVFDFIKLVRFLRRFNSNTKSRGKKRKACEMEYNWWEKVQKDKMKEFEALAPKLFDPSEDYFFPDEISHMIHEYLVPPEDYKKLEYEFDLCYVEGYELWDMVNGKFINSLEFFYSDTYYETFLLLGNGEEMSYGPCRFELMKYEKDYIRKKMKAVIPWKEPEYFFVKI